MKVLVIYDSVFGNTEKIARAIGEALAAEVIPVGSASAAQLAGTELLFLGSPTRGFRPTPAITSFLKSLPAGALKGVRGAAFDTRIDVQTIKPRFFRWFVHKMGYADKSIAAGLKRAGASTDVPRAGYFVLASEGPLQEGELERAAEWAKKVSNREA